MIFDRGWTLICPMCVMGNKQSYGLCHEGTSLGTGCRLIQSAGSAFKKSTRANGLGRRRRYEEVAVCSRSQMTTSRDCGELYDKVHQVLTVHCFAVT